MPAGYQAPVRRYAGRVDNVFPASKVPMPVRTVDGIGLPNGVGRHSRDRRSYLARRYPVVNENSRPVPIYDKGVGDDKRPGHCAPRRWISGPAGRFSGSTRPSLSSCRPSLELECGSHGSRRTAGTAQRPVILAGLVIQLVGFRLIARPSLSPAAALTSAETPARPARI